MEYKCVHCNKVLSKSYLSIHENKCLKKREKSSSTICIHCDKNFSSVYTLDKHKCKNRKCIKCKNDCNNSLCLSCCEEEYSNNIKNDYEKLKLDYYTLLSSHHNLQHKYEIEVNIKNKIENQYNALLEKCTQAKNINKTVVYNNNSTNTNNNITLKQVVSTLEPISHDDIKDSMVHFTNKYIDDGVKGFAKFMVDFVCNNKIVTSDHSRNTIAYRTTYENFIRDPECINIINSTLKQNSNYIINVLDERKEHYRKLMDENSDDFDTHLIKAAKIHELKRITEASKSENADVNIKDISNILCNHGAKNYNKCVELISKQK